MTAVVVDTNVAVTANGKSDHAGHGCISECIGALNHAIRHSIVVIDADGLILREYRNNLSASGQPGAGDAFFRWLFNNQANPSRCEQVIITPMVNEPDNFSEIPADPDLADFDRSDRKFLAVALASPNHPVVLNATDKRSWWDHREVLERHAVGVRFLCPELMARLRGQ